MLDKYEPDSIKGRLKYFVKGFMNKTGVLNKILKQKKRMVVKMTLTEQKTDPIVSVIIPVYNTETYVARAVKSVCNQTIKAIQIILVDDASSDGSLKVCKKLASEDDRIEVYQHEKNRGVSAARNTGLLHAKGKYIAFVDGDDYVDRDMLELLLELMGDVVTDLAACGYYINDIPKMGKVKNRKKMYSLECAKEIEGYKGSLVKGYVCNKLFKKELVDLYQLRFNEQVHICEDALFCQQYVKHCRTINYDPAAKYHYVRRKGSAMCGGVTEKRMSVLETYPIIMEIGRDYKDKELNKILWVSYFNHYISILKDVVKYPSEKQKEYGDRVFPYIKKNLSLVLTSKHMTFKRKILTVGLRIGYPFWKVFVGKRSI